jgi:hypothetical protein
MTPLYIAAATDYLERIDDGAPPADLKPLVTDAVGASVRRIGRFIQLALIGAGRSAKSAPLPPDTAVYLGSGRGDLEVTIEVMQTLLRDGQAPKPLSFINTVSNAACYYVAQNLKVLGRSSFVCNRYFAFEAVLQLAALDLESGTVRSALVGTVDVVVPPLAGHRIRLGLSTQTEVADASHWVQLRREASTQSLGQLLATEFFPDRPALEAWLSRQPTNSEWLLATGQFMEKVEAEEWASKLKLDVFEYRSARGYYDSQSGAAIGEYLRGNDERTLLHLNRDPSGRYSAMVITKNQNRVTAKNAKIA